jgi:hypothetical protein
MDNIFAADLVDQRLDLPKVQISVLHDILLSDWLPESLPLPEVIGPGLFDSHSQKTPKIKCLLAMATSFTNSF